MLKDLREELGITKWVLYRDKKLVATVQNMLGNRSRTTVNVTDPPTMINSSTATAVPRPTTSDSDVGGVHTGTQQRVADFNEALYRTERQYNAGTRMNHNGVKVQKQNYAQNINQRSLPAANEERFVIEETTKRRRGDPLPATNQENLVTQKRRGVRERGKDSRQYPRDSMNERAHQKHGGRKSQSFGETTNDKILWLNFDLQNALLPIRYSILKYWYTVLFARFLFSNSYGKCVSLYLGLAAKAGLHYMLPRPCLSYQAPHPFVGGAW